MALTHILSFVYFLRLPHFTSRLCACYKDLDVTSATLRVSCSMPFPVPLLHDACFPSKFKEISRKILVYVELNFRYSFFFAKSSHFVLYRVFNLKVDRILIWVIYLLRFATCYFTQLTCIYSKCWKWCPFISMHLSTRFTMFLATFLHVLSFFNHFRHSTIYWRLPSKFFKETLSTVGVRHRF